MFRPSSLHEAAPEQEKENFLLFVAGVLLHSMAMEGGSLSRYLIKKLFFSFTPLDHLAGEEEETKNVLAPLTLPREGRETYGRVIS